MKLIGALAAALLALAAYATVAAAPNSGTTTIPPTQPSGSTMLVNVSVFGGYPIVPYEYAIQNECNYNNKRNPGTSQRDDIVYWTDIDGSGHAQATMPIYLQSIALGSACKVFLIKNNTVVKGSTTYYTVD